MIYLSKGCWEGSSGDVIGCMGVSKMKEKLLGPRVQRLIKKTMAKLKYQLSERSKDRACRLTTVKLLELFVK